MALIVGIKIIRRAGHTNLWGPYLNMTLSLSKQSLHTLDTHFVFKNSYIGCLHLELKRPSTSLQMQLIQPPKAYIPRWPQAARAK